MTKHNIEAIKIMTDFVEGTMTIADFKIEFDYNPDIERALLNDPNGKSIISSLKSENWLSASGQVNICGKISRFLFRYDYPCVPTKQYSEKFGFLLDIQPSWVDILDENFLHDNIISLIPQDIKSKTGRIKWCKERIKELFKYDSKPPRWVQSPEWLIVDGKPLVFKSQSKENKNDKCVNFYFYDPETIKEYVVTQYY